MQAPQLPPPDSVRAVLRTIFANPEYEWRARRSILDAVSGYWNALMAFMDTMAAEHPIGFLAVMLLLTLVSLAMFMHIGLVLRRALRPPPKPADIGGAPLPAVRDAPWHLAQAGALAGAGRYPEALGHRFLALVLELERRRAVAVRASKTPAEYAREVRLDDAGRRIFAALVSTLYAALFGGRACDAGAFAEFDREAASLAHRATVR